MLRIILSLMIILVACAPNKTVYQLPDGYKNMSQNQQLATTANHEGPYPFISFDLDADFNGIDNTVEAEYAHKDGGVEALYKHRLKKIYYAGDYALNELHPLLSLLTFSEFSNERDVIEQVIHAFDLPNDATLHLKVEYPSGEIVHYTNF